MNSGINRCIARGRELIRVLIRGRKPHVDIAPAACDVLMPLHPDIALECTDMLPWRLGVPVYGVH
jgi:hypothetical protein